LPDKHQQPHPAGLGSMIHMQSEIAFRAIARCVVEQECSTPPSICLKPQISQASVDTSRRLCTPAHLLLAELNKCDPPDSRVASHSLLCSVCNCHAQRANHATLVSTSRPHLLKHHGTAGRKQPTANKHQTDKQLPA
jgi:hypothetical protein